MEGICSLHGKFPQIQFSLCLANRYQPLPYGTHWMWPDVSWSTPGPAFEQNTMLLLSDSMDRLKIDPSWNNKSILLSNKFHSNFSPLILKYATLVLLDRSGGIGFRCVADVE